MAAIQIPNLPVAISVTGTEQLEAVQSGTSVRVTSQQIANLSPAGTVTTVSVATANGVSGTVTDPTSTPAISLTLGNITPTSVTSATLTGGTTASSSLTLQSTSGVGTTDSILFKVGNNGATTAMAVDSSGNVGIGTSAPSFKFDIQSPTTLVARYYCSDATASSYAGFQVQIANGSVSSAFYNYSGATWLGTTSNHPLLFLTNNTERMRIDASGNVMIGIGSSSQKFLVSGTNASGAVSAQLQNLDASGGSVTQFNVYHGSTSNLVLSSGNGYTAITSPTSVPIIFSTNSTECMRIDASGNVGIGTSSPSASAILDAQSTTKGVRFPNMTTTQKNAVSSPAAGLVVFDTTLAKLCVYSGAAWQTVTSV